MDYKTAGVDIEAGYESVETRGPWRTGRLFGSSFLKEY